MLKTAAEILMIPLILENIPINSTIIKRSFSPHILQQYLDTFIIKSTINEKELFELMMLILGNMKEI